MFRIEALIARISGFKMRVEVMDTIVLQVGEQADSEWFTDLLKNALASYSTGAVEDAPALVTVLRKTGLEGVQEK